MRLHVPYEPVAGLQHLFFGTDTMKAGAKVVHRSRFNFLREATIWYDRDANRPPQSAAFENVSMANCQLA
jgi:hypothetical protein